MLLRIILLATTFMLSSRTVVSAQSISLKTEPLEFLLGRGSATLEIPASERDAVIFSVQRRVIDQQTGLPFLLFALFVGAETHREKGWRFDLDYRRYFGKQETAGTGFYTEFGLSYGSYAVNISRDPILGRRRTVFNDDIQEFTFLLKTGYQLRWGERWVADLGMAYRLGGLDKKLAGTFRAQTRRLPAFDIALGYYF